MEKPFVSKNHPLKNIFRYVNYSQLNEGSNNCYRYVQVYC